MQKKRRLCANRESKENYVKMQSNERNSEKNRK